jgi:hypothetical protein
VGNDARFTVTTSGWPAQWMGAEHAVVAAAHMLQALPQIRFRDAQPLPLSEQDHCGVALAAASKSSHGLSRS